MKKTLKILSIFLMTVIILSNIVMAYDWTGSIDTLSEATDKSTASGSVQNIVGSIIAITRVVAVGIAIIMLIAIAMKYMMAAPGDKADIKKHAVVYVVGAIVLFASSGILGIIAQFATQIS